MIRKTILGLTAVAALGVATVRAPCAWSASASKLNIGFVETPALQEAGDFRVYRVNVPR